MAVQSVRAAARSMAQFLWGALRALLKGLAWGVLLMLAGFGGLFQPPPPPPRPRPPIEVRDDDDDDKDPAP